MVDAMAALRAAGFEWGPVESGIYFHHETGIRTELAFLDLRTVPRASVRSTRSIDLLMSGRAGLSFRPTASGCCIHGLMKRPAI